MKLIIHLCFLCLPLAVTAYGDSADDRRAAALEHISGHRNLETCKGIGGGCWWDSQCCGDLDCLGVIPSNYACGNDPGKIGEYCDIAYRCAKGFECQNGKCVVGCFEHHEGCYVDNDCCGGMECLGVNPMTWACGYTPGEKMDYCDPIYTCKTELVCDNSICKSYDQVLLRDDNSKKCAQGSPPGELKIMTYNIFQLPCIGPIYSCDSASGRKHRMKKLVAWMKDRDEDVVVVQELYGYLTDILLGMQLAGFCHYVSTPYGIRGSGLAIFSKHQIEDFGFVDFIDGFQITNPEAFADRGVMYAKINNGGTISHIFNTHTQSESLTGKHGDIWADAHKVRMKQYVIIKEFTEKFKIPEDQLILFGGDFNEDMFAEGKHAGYYPEMIEALAVEAIQVDGKQKFSYDTTTNPFLKTYYTNPDKTYEEYLDFIFVSRSGAEVAPSDASCRILHPTWPKDCKTKDCEISDHYPVSCAIENIKPSNEYSSFFKFF